MSSLVKDRMETQTTQKYDSGISSIIFSSEDGNEMDMRHLHNMIDISYHNISRKDMVALALKTKSKIVMLKREDGIKFSHIKIMVGEIGIDFFGVDE